MRTPVALLPLIEYGIVEEVLRPLMSGKEAQIFLVLAGGEERVAKIYKEAEQRTFKHRTAYTEGRGTRNSRDRRAMGKHSRHGKAKDEAAWRSAEVDAIYRLQSAGVRVPVPYNFVDGVLIMELVKGADGRPAPRLGDVDFDPATAKAVFDHLLREVVRMLCAGVVHGDLSDFNVLMSADGPVIIDFPQAIDPASNQSARKLLIRDVDNLHNFLARFVPGRPPPFAQEMWDLYEQNLLTPETELRGRHSRSSRPANTAEVLSLIGEVNRDEERRRGASARPSGRGSRSGPRSSGPSGTPPAAAAQEGPRGPRGPKVEVVISPPSQGGRGGRSRGQGGAQARAPARAQAQRDAPPAEGGQARKPSADRRPSVGARGGPRSPQADPQSPDDRPRQRGADARPGRPAQAAKSRDDGPPGRSPTAAPPASGQRPTTDQEGLERPRKRRRRRRKPRGDAPKRPDPG